MHKNYLLQFTDYNLSEKLGKDAIPALEALLEQEIAKHHAFKHKSYEEQEQLPEEQQLDCFRDLKWRVDAILGLRNNELPYIHSRECSKWLEIALTASISLLSLGVVYDVVFNTFNLVDPRNTSQLDFLNWRTDFQSTLEAGLHLLVYSKIALFLGFGFFKKAMDFIMAQDISHLLIL